MTMMHLNDIGLVKNSKKKCLIKKIVNFIFKLIYSNHFLKNWYFIIH